MHNVESMPSPKHKSSLEIQYSAYAERFIQPSKIEEFAKPIRAAVARLARVLHHTALSDLSDLYAPRWRFSSSALGQPLEHLTAWNLIATWITGIARGALDAHSSLRDAIEWFSGSPWPSDFPGADAPPYAVTNISAVRSSYSELLPYLLDPHGPGSRLSVRKSPTTRQTRIRKKAEGIFYTPSDVAGYMVRAALTPLSTSTHPITVLDPACGTGVFLRAALRELARLRTSPSLIQLATETLYGFDIDACVLNASAHVLLHDTLVPDTALIPQVMWHALRANLICVDTLIVRNVPRTAMDKTARLARQNLRSALSARVVPPPEEQSATSGEVNLGSLLPELTHGVTAIIGNPPYTEIGERKDRLALASEFVTLRPTTSSNADVYPLFLEQMIRLTTPTTAGGALVVPLSIATNLGPQYIACRKLIARTPGLWRFAFFDREPHALFGEDVKTRSAIVVWEREPSSSRPAILTGPLRKWRGPQRAAMFQKITFTPIAIDIAPGIPKIEGDIQAQALATLSHRSSRFLQFVQAWDRTTLEEIDHLKPVELAIGPTAYNFINVLLRTKIAKEQPLSQNPFIKLAYTSPHDTYAAFAVLVSQLTFWWWHTHGDGFHVNRKTLEDLPIGLDILQGAAGHRLAELGRQMWAALVAEPSFSKNRGRLSVAFPVTRNPELRREIDRVLVAATGLPPSFVAELDRFTNRVIEPTHDHPQ